MLAFFRYAALFIFLFIIQQGAFAQGSWVQVPTALQSNPGTHVQVGGLWGIAMVDTGTGFAAGYASVANGFSGVLRKTAGDPTWYVIPSTSFGGLLPASHSLWSAVSAVGTNVWVCGSNGRLYRSTDSGNSWAPAMNGIIGTNTLFDLFFKNANEGMAVGSGGRLYYTSDGGSNWVAQTPPFPLHVGAEFYAVHSAGNFWYVTGGTGIMLKGTPQTSPSNWTDVSANLPTNIGLIEGLQFLDDNVGTIAGVIATGSPIHRTVNGATSFSGIGGGLPTGAYNAVHFFNQDNGWVGNALTALYYTTNAGSNWTQATITPLPSQTLSNWLTRFSFIGNQSGYACGGAPGTSSVGWILKFIPDQDPDISTTATSMDFGAFSCGPFVEKIFSVSNTGAGALNISSITFSHSEFSLPSAIPTPVPPLGGATFPVRWTPTQAGPAPAGARMTIHSNDPVHSTWHVDLSGVFNSGTLTLTGPGAGAVSCVNDSVDMIVNANVTGNIAMQILAFEHVNGVTGIRMVSPQIGSALSGSSNMTFRYAASSAGAWSGTYRILYGDPLCPKIAVLVFDGTANSSTLSAAPAVVEFGEVCIGKFKDMTITLSNTGNITAVVSSRTHVSGRDAFPNQHFAPFGPIPPNETRQYTVRFAPGSGDVGAIEGVYALRVDPCGDSLILVLRGAGVQPSVTFLPTSLLVLGPAPIGQVTEEQVTIINSGNGSIQLDAIELRPAHPRLALTGLPPLPFTLSPSQSIVVTTRFQPDRNETIISELSVRYSGPCVDSSRLPVTASSASHPTIMLASRLDMGQNICPGPLHDTLWVRNLGPGVLTLKRFSISGRDPLHFSVLSPGVPAAVAVSDSLPIVLSYQAPVPGSSEAELTIEHDDPKTFNFSTVQLMAERIAVGWVVEGDSVTTMLSCADIGANRSFSLRNTGLRPRYITDLRIIRGGDVFQVASTPLPAEIPAGSSRPFEVTFTPTGKSDYEGTLEISVGPCDETMLLTLRGSGQEAALTFTPSPLDFGAVSAGNVSTLQLNVSNPATAQTAVTNMFILPPQAVGQEVFSVVSPPPMPFVLNASQSQELTLRFAPDAIASYTASLCVVVATPCPDTLYLPIMGEGVSTGIGINRTRLEFALDPCNDTERCDSISVLNNGAVPVTLTAADFDDTGWFTITPPAAFPIALQPGTRATFVVCALPGPRGARSSTLRFLTSDAGKPELAVRVISTRDSSAFEVMQRVVDFGTIAPCQVGISKPITIRNTGAMMEIIDTLHATAPFHISDALPVVLQPGQERTLMLRFLPQRFDTFTDTLFFFNARCGHSIAVLLMGEMRNDNISITPDPLVFTNVPVGSSTIRNFTLENRFLPEIRITDIRIDPPGAFASWGAYPKLVSKNGVVELPIQFNPQSPGTHNAIACIILDRPCPDTLCVALEGATGEGELAASPAILDFGAVAQCSDIVLQDTVRNPSSMPIRLFASRIDGQHAVHFELLNGITVEETLDGGNERIFEIRVHPDGANDGPLTARLLIENSGRPAELDIPIIAQRVTMLPDAGGVLDFGSISAGAPATRTITLRNNGSAGLRYATYSAPAGIQIMPGLPFNIDAASSIDIDIIFTPAVAGTFSSSMTLYTDDPCEDSTVFLLQAEVLDGIEMHTLQLGSPPWCLPAHGSVLLRNLLAETVEITELTLEGPNAAAWSILSPVSLPITLAAGDSLSIDMLFNASAADIEHRAELLARLVTSTSTIQSTATLLAYPHSGMLQLSGASDFGQAEISGDAVVRTLTFVNNATFAIHVTAADINGEDFFLISSNPPLPATIGPGDVIEYNISFSPAATRMYRSTFALSIDAPCILVQDISMYGEGVDSRPPLILSMPDITGAPDDIVEIPIRIDRNPGRDIDA